MKEWKKISRGRPSKCTVGSQRWMCETHINYWVEYIAYPAFWLSRLGIRVGWGIETNGRFEAERPPTSVGPPSGGRAALFSPMYLLYSTGHHGLVQAIFWHTCPDLDLGPCLVGGSDKYTVWHSCRMGYRNQWQIRGRKGPQLRVGELLFSPLCTLCIALDITV